MCWRLNEVGKTRRQEEVWEGGECVIKRQNYCYLHYVQKSRSSTQNYDFEPSTVRGIKNRGIEENLETKRNEIKLST